MAARDAPIFGGGGSGAVVPKMTVTVYDALLSRLGGKGGVICTVVDKNTDYFSENHTSHKAEGVTSLTDCCGACAVTGLTKTFTWSTDKDLNGCWCHPENIVKKTKRNNFSSGFCTYNSSLRLIYANGNDLAQATAAVINYSIIFIFSALSASGFSLLQHVGCFNPSLLYGVRRRRLLKLSLSFWPSHHMRRQTAPQSPSIRRNLSKTSQRKIIIR